MSNELFPKVKKSINDLIDDEEGNIPRSKLVVIGSTIMLMGMIMGIDVYATHRSHTSHTWVCQEKCVSNLKITKK